MSAEFPHCEICPIIRNPSPVDQAFRIYDGENWRATLRENQALLGTTYITHKEHVGSLDRLTHVAESEFVAVRNRLIHAVNGVFRPDVVNLSCQMNDAFQDRGVTDFAPQPHVRYHFKPRYSEARSFAGVEFTDPEFGHYLREGRVQNVSLAVGSAIAAQIRRYF